MQNTFDEREIESHFSPCKPGERQNGKGFFKLEIFMSMRMDMDPMEREIYVKCPECNRKVFDNGIENELCCPSCETKFATDKE